jgi:hypothetical protein
MAAEIARVLTDPVLADRLKSNAFDQINQYSPEAYMRSLAGHYEKVLERHSIHRRS